MVNSLREKIQNLISSMDRYGDDNVYYRNAKKGAPLPYIVFFTIGELNGNDTEDENLDYTIQISAYDVFANEEIISEEHEELKTILSISNLAGLSGYKINWCNYINSREPVNDPEIYNKISLYKISIKKL